MTPDRVGDIDLEPDAGPEQGDLDDQSEPVRILFICTANRCRSPLAEVIARDALARREVNALVLSAGTLNGGFPAATGSVRVARELGLDLSAHRSRQLNRAMIDAADVVVTMESEHVLDIATLAPGAQAWSLTAKELSNRAELVAAHQGVAAHPGSSLTPDELQDWVRSAGMRPLEALLAEDLDVEDPIGRSVRAFRQTADELDRLLDTIFDAWFGPGPRADRPRRRWSASRASMPI